MKSKKKLTIAPKTEEQQIADCKKSFEDSAWNSWRFQPPPTRQFDPDEKVLIGNLRECTVVEKLYDGLAYLVRSERGYNVWWWYDVDKIQEHIEETFFNKYRSHPCASTPIESLIRLTGRGGLVVDPRFQRGYVWTDENKTALIDSIVDDFDIGSFLIIGHQGYKHTGSTEIRHYRTLDGRIVDIPARDDYTYSIVDGQQRMTTIYNFVTDRWEWRGNKFSSLTRGDQSYFMNRVVSCRSIDEEYISLEEVVRLFIGTNRGVPQDASHMESVKAFLETLKTTPK